MQNPRFPHLKQFLKKSSLYFLLVDVHHSCCCCLISPFVCFQFGPLLLLLNTLTVTLQNPVYSLQTHQWIHFLKRLLQIYSADKCDLVFVAFHEKMSPCCCL